MAVKLEDIIAQLDPELRREIKERAAELIAEENTRRDLRRALRRAKVGMARELGIGWADVSRLERQSDLLLSTLRDKLEAMGGTLSLTVSFPDRAPVELCDLAGYVARDLPADRAGHPEEGPGSPSVAGTTGQQPA